MSAFFRHRSLAGWLLVLALSGVGDGLGLLAHADPDRCGAMCARTCCKPSDCSVLRGRCCCTDRAPVSLPGPTADRAVVTAVLALSVPLVPLFRVSDRPTSAPPSPDPAIPDPPPRRDLRHDATR